MRYLKIPIERIIGEEDMLLDFVQDMVQCSCKHSIYHEVVPEDITTDAIAQEERTPDKKGKVLKE